MKIFEYMSTEALFPLVNREVLVLPMQHVGELSAEYIVLVSAYDLSGKAIFRKFLIGKTESWNQSERMELTLKCITIRRIVSEEARNFGLRATIGAIQPVKDIIPPEYEPLLEGQILNGL